MHPTIAQWSDAKDAAASLSESFLCSVLVAIMYPLRIGYLSRFSI
jgi:hypothetical protein